MIVVVKGGLGLSLVFTMGSCGGTMKCLYRLQSDLKTPTAVYLGISGLEASILEVNMSECVTLLDYGFIGAACLMIKTLGVREFTSLSFQVFIFISLFYLLF